MGTTNDVRLGHSRGYFFFSTHGRIWANRPSVMHEWRFLMMTFQCGTKLSPCLGLSFGKTTSDHHYMDRSFIQFYVRSTIMATTSLRSTAFIATISQRFVYAHRMCKMRLEGQVKKQARVLFFFSTHATHFPDKPSACNHVCGLQTHHHYMWSCYCHRVHVTVRTSPATQIN